MQQRIRLDIDLDFSFSHPAGDIDRPELSGTVKAAGSTVEVYCNEPKAFDGSLPSLDAVRALAKGLAKQGLTVSIAGPGGALVSLGDVRAPLAQRLVTRSPHINVGSATALAPLLGLARRMGSREQPVSLLPPGTPFPLVPTVNRTIRRRGVTTTHHAAGSGRPRLIFVQNSETWDGQIPREFNLVTGTSVIGSSAEADLVLDGLLDLHAEVVHNDADEYVLVPHGPVSGSVNQEGESVLRTGARIQLGQWCLAFFREEYADHGRPFGGRSGGEFAYQRPQRDPRTGQVEQDGSEGVGDFRRKPR